MTVPPTLQCAQRPARWSGGPSRHARRTRVREATPGSGRGWRPRNFPGAVAPRFHHQHVKDMTQAPLTKPPHDRVPFGKQREVPNIMTTLAQPKTDNLIEVSRLDDGHRRNDRSLVFGQREAEDLIYAAAYARIFHPLDDGPDAQRWADVARLSRMMHASADWDRINDAPEERRHRRSFPGDPAIGNLDVHALSALCAILTGHTGTPERCWFAVWDGWDGSIRRHPPRAVPRPRSGRCHQSRRPPRNGNWTCPAPPCAGTWSTSPPVSPDPQADEPCTHPGTGPPPTAGNVSGTTPSPPAADKSPPNPTHPPTQAQSRSGTRFPGSHDPLYVE